MKSIRSAAFAALCFALLSSAALAAPAVTLSRASGGPTTTTTVKLSGFAARKAVDIFFDTTDTCLVITGSTGRGSCAVTIPADAQPRQHWFSAVERLSGNGAQKPFLVRVNWPQYHGATAAHDGFNRLENTIGVENAGKLALKWLAVPSTAFTGTPVVANGRVYAAGFDDNLYAVDAIKGTAIAGFPKAIAQSLAGATPVFANNNVYISSHGASTGRLYAFNGATGAPVAGFSKAVGDGADGAIATAGSNIYVADRAGKIHGFNALTGAILGGFPVTVAGSPVIKSGITIANGKLFIGANDQKLYSYRADTGSLLGSADVGGAFQYSTPAASGSTVFVAPGGGTFLANYSENAAVQWNSPFMGLNTPNGAPAVANGRVFVSDGDGKVYSFDAATGAVKWTADLGFPARGSVVIANGVAYVSTTQKLFALNAATGATLWFHNNVAFAGQSPVVANGMVYVANAGGGLQAFSINGLAPAAPEAGGELGVRPSLSRLKPDISLKPRVQ